jgi:hypothetical protein
MLGPLVLLYSVAVFVLMVVVVIVIVIVLWILAYSIHMYIPWHIRYSILVYVLSRAGKNYPRHYREGIGANSNLSVHLHNRECSRRCIFPVV